MCALCQLLGVETMATDFSDYFAYGALASPERTPEHTPPELSVRKPSSRSRTPRDFSIKSAPLPSFDSPDSHNGSVHGLDPNRFTPSLHASLVSEILSLRRELDSKHRFIDNLEDGFKTVQSENETLSEHLRESNKKSRHLEHKFKNLENGTFDAVEGLLAERDSFKHANQELRTRLERVSKKLKTLEDDKIQSKTLWDKERQDWVNEKRQLEQKAHISETRLRRVIEEMNAQQNALINQHRRDDNSGDSDVASMHSYRMSKHTRNQSSMSTRSFNRSVGGGSRLGMTSLANELNSDDEEYDTEDLELEEDDLPLIAGNRLSMYSRTSKSSDSKAKKILGLTMSTTPEPSSEDDGRTAPADSARGPSIAARFGLHMPKVGLKSSDTSRTSSRSTSPATSARQNDTPASDPPNAAITKWTPDAKISPPTQVSNHKDAVKQATNTRMPSSSTTKRIAEAPISPPDTPELVQAVDAGIKIQTKLNYQTASTQTDVSVNQGLALRRTAPVAPLEVPQIPAITIQPPMSPSFGDAILPPGVRSMSVQTDHTSNTSMRDAGMQTEEIKVDQRSIKLPPHLLPSALDYDENKESTLRHVDQELKGITKYKPIMHRSTFSKDGNRLPLKAMDLPPPRLRSLSQERRQQSGYAAYKEADDYSHYRSADSGTTGKSGQSRDGNIEKTPENRAGPIRPSVRTMLNGLPKTVPENREISPAYMNATADRRLPSVPGQPKESVGNHFRSRPSSSRGSVTTIRTAPFFSSRERDPGRPSSTGSQSGKAHAPPFPIPGRISSRPLSHDGPQSPTRRDVLSLRSQQSGKGTRYAPEGGLRKVQSSGTMRTDTHMSPRRRRRGPNLEPIRSVAFDAPSMNNLLPPGVSPPGHGHLQSPSNPLFDLDSPDFDRDSAVEEEEEKTQDNAIVDAIAATMVGEWMWKYVRRRRSFGLGESRGDQIDDGAGSSGIRHKRWVWLSPYEHTVMWSAKQPNSGPALLGKAGRKRE